MLWSAVSERLRRTEQRPGDPLANDRGRHVGIAGDDGRHQRRVCYIQAFDPVHPALRVDDRIRIARGPQLAAPGRVVIVHGSVIEEALDRLSSRDFRARAQTRFHSDRGPGRLHASSR